MSKISIQINSAPESEFTAPYGSEEIFAYTKYVQLYLSGVKNTLTVLLLPAAIAAFATGFYLVGIMCGIAFAALILPLLTMKSAARRTAENDLRTYRFYDSFFTVQTDKQAFRIPYDKVKAVEKYGFMLLVLPDKSAFVFKTDRAAYIKQKIR